MAGVQVVDAGRGWNDCVPNCSLHCALSRSGHGNCGRMSGQYFAWTSPKSTPSLERLWSAVRVAKHWRSTLKMQR